MNRLDELERLQKLKERGTITEEEFIIEKKKLLNNYQNSDEDNSNSNQENIRQENIVNANVCVKCGNTVFKGDRFCVKCGTKVSKVKNLTSYNQQNQDPIKIKFSHLIIGIILAIFVIIIVVALLSNEDKSNIDNTNNSNISTSISKENIDEGKTTISNNKLSLKDVQMNKKFTSLDEMNEVTQKIISCAWQYIKEVYPNAKWNHCTIYSEDGYGRFNLSINFVKSSTSEEASMESIIVWVKDINNDDLGYYYNYNYTYYTEWGTPLPENIGE